MPKKSILVMQVINQELVVQSQHLTCLRLIVNQLKDLALLFLRPSLVQLYFSFPSSVFSCIMRSSLVHLEGLCFWITRWFLFVLLQQQSSQYNSPWIIIVSCVHVHQATLQSHYCWTSVFGTRLICVFCIWHFPKLWVLCEGSLQESTLSFLQ